MNTWNQNIYNAENQNIQITCKNTKSIKYFINDKYEALINFDLNKISKYNPGRNYKIQAIELVYIFDKNSVWK
ncbi:hypothetical protein [Mycoplasmopsis felifaucium]|uniref:Uncharacterized protein n=1 Tax=Mycoplasmopsis felifaucium TaxID=35768 RepID=A0ABZ2RWR1_9BACT